MCGLPGAHAWVDGVGEGIRRDARRGGPMARMEVGIAGGDGASAKPKLPGLAEAASLGTCDAAERQAQAAAIRHSFARLNSART